MEKIYKTNCADYNLCKTTGIDSVHRLTFIKKLFTSKWKIIQTLLITLLMFTNVALQAQGMRYYWVGKGDGTSWNQLNNWSSASGGAGGAGISNVPTTTNTVVFDAGSTFTGTRYVTISGTVSCDSLIVENCITLPRFYASGSTPSINIHGSLILQAGTTFASNMNLNFNSSRAQETITTNGVALYYSFGLNGAGSMSTFNGSATYKLANNTDFHNMTLNAGTLDLNGKNIVCNTIAINSGGNITFVGSTIDCRYRWNSSSGPGLTLANTANSLIRVGVENFSAKVNEVFHNVEFYWGYGSPGYGNMTCTHTISNGTYNKITVTKGLTEITTVVTDSLVISTSAVINFNTVTVKKYFEAKPAVCGGQVRLYSSNPTLTTNRTITLTGAAVNIERAAIHDLIFSIPVTAVNSYDWGNNSNLTVTMPLAGKTLYWRGGGGYWSDPTRWSTTSGGSPANCLPTLADNVVFDANSNTGGTAISETNPVYLDVDAWCNDLTWNGVPGTPYFNIQGNWSTGSNYANFNPNLSKIMIGGSLFFQSTMKIFVEMSFYTNEFIFVGDGTHTITTNGVPVCGSLNFQSVAGTGSWKLIDDLIIHDKVILSGAEYSNSVNSGAGRIYFRRGSLDFSGRKVITYQFNAPADNTLPGFSGVLSSRSLNIAGATFDSYIGWQYLGGQPLTVLQSANSSIIAGNDHNNNSVQIFTKDGDYYHNAELRKLTGSSIQNSSTTTGITYFNKITLSGVSTTVNKATGGTIQPDSLLFVGYGTYTIARSMNIGKYLGTPTTCGGLSTITNTSAITLTMLDNTISQSDQVKISNTNIHNISMNITGYPGNYTIQACNLTGTYGGWHNLLGIPQTFYWVGGTGNWNDGDNWSINSGLSGGFKGDGTGCIPGSIDNVIFDDGSFTANGQAVTVDNTAYCNNMNWIGTLYNPILRIEQNLRIYGSLELQSGMTVPNINTTARLYFLTNRANETIRTNGVSVLPYYIYFEAADKASGWKLLDNFTAYQAVRVYFNKGTLDFNGKTWFKFDTFQGTNGVTSTLLILTNATLNSGVDVFAGTYNYTGDIIADNSNIILTSNNSSATVSFTCQAGAQYHNLSVGYTTGASIATITRGKFNKVTVLSGNARFNTATGNTIETDTIVLANDNNNLYEFFSGSTLQVNKAAYMSGTACSQIYLRSTAETTRAKWDIRKDAANYAGISGVGVKDTLLVDYAYIHGIEAATVPGTNAHLYKGMHCPDVLGSGTAWSYGIAPNNYNQGWARMDAHIEGATPFEGDRMVSCTFLPYVLSSVDFGPNPDSKFKWFRVNKATFKTQWDALPGTQLQKFNAIDTKFPLLSTAPEITVYKGGYYTLCLDYGNSCITYDDVFIDLVMLDECSQVSVCDGGLLSADLLYLPPSEYATIEMETAPGSDVYAVVDLVSSPFTVTKADHGRKMYLYELNATTEFAILQLVVEDPTEPPLGKHQYIFCPGATVEGLISSLQAPPNGIISIYYNQNDPSPLSPSVALQNGHVYWASQTKNGCESVDKLPILVEIKTPCAVYEIWNWDDLSYLNTIIANQKLYNANPAAILGGNGDKLEDYAVFQVMQNIGTPNGVNECGQPNFGDGAATPQNGGVAHINYGDNTSSKQYGWYGYQNYTGLLASGFSGVEGNGCGWDGAKGWKAMGDPFVSTGIGSFNGVFDGQGFEISGLWIKNSTAGIFNYILNATIKNIGVILAQRGIDVGTVGAGGTLADYAQDALITNCYVKGKLEGQECYLGGLIGGLRRRVTISNCFTEGSIKATNAGGIVAGSNGYNFADRNKIHNCYSLCDITNDQISSSATAGGIAGELGSGAGPGYTEFKNCFATGNIEGWFAGGIYGYNYMAAPLDNCFYLGKSINSTSSDPDFTAGRLIGVTLVNGLVTNCYGLECALVNGKKVTDGTATNKNGADINFTDATNPDTYKTAWGTDYTANWTEIYSPNYHVGIPNMPILSVFDRDVFACAMQQPIAENCPEPYQIWNWEDLSKLSNIVSNPTLWKSYGKKAVLMQNIGFLDGKNECGDDNFGNGSTMTDPAIIALHPGDKKIGWYGYQGNANGSTGSQNTNFGWAGADGWTPIGTNSVPFEGEFDGQGFEISGLWINKPLANTVGLFERIDKSTVVNLGVNTTSAGITGNSNVGGITGWAYHDSNITNCFVNGTISGNSNVGGIVGMAESVPGFEVSINNCYANVTLNCNGNAGGGILGNTVEIGVAYISNCYTTGSINGHSTNFTEYLGGIFGGANISRIHITHCYSTCDILNGNNYVGGIAGNINNGAGNASIKNCFALNNRIFIKSPAGSNTGRIVGWLTTLGSASLAENRNYKDMDCTIGVGNLTNKNGLPIGCDLILDPTTYSGVWGTGYATHWTHTYDPDYNHGAKVNLPILSVFNKADFSCAKQEPKVEACNLSSVYRWWYISSPYSNSNPSAFDIPAGTLGTTTGSMLGYYNEQSKNYNQPFVMTTGAIRYNGSNPLNELFVPASTGGFIQGRGIAASLDTTIAAFNPPTMATFAHGITPVANNGNINVSVFNTDLVPAQSAKRGINLIGNPYPSHINFDAFYNTNSAVIENTMWIRGWNKTVTPANPEGLMMYDTYNATSGVGTKLINNVNVTSDIPPIQGFWVKAIASGTVTFRDTHKTSGTQILRAPAADANKIVRIRISATATNAQDEMLVVLNSAALDSYDPYDSEKMSHGNLDIPELYSLVNNRELVINGIKPLTGKPVEISLGFRTGKAGEFRISGTFENWDNVEVSIYDDNIKKHTILTNKEIYNFNSEAGVYPKRFTLQLSGTTDINSIENNNTFIYVNSENRIVVHSDLYDTPCTVYSSVGQKIAEETIISNPQILNCILEAGVYLVKIENKTEKVIIK